MPVKTLDLTPQEWKILVAVARAWDAIDRATPSGMPKLEAEEANWRLDVKADKVTIEITTEEVI